MLVDAYPRAKGLCNISPEEDRVIARCAATLLLEAGATGDELNELRQVQCAIPTDFVVENNTMQRFVKSVGGGDRLPFKV